MGDKTNRRDLIVDTASRLFVDHGYDATSVRQIAEDVGCTEAALYYHFKDGKRELLQAVLECNMPDLIGILDQCEEAVSLHDLITQFGQLMVRLGPVRLKRLRWLHTEFPRLSDEERALFHQKYLSFHQALSERVQRTAKVPVSRPPTRSRNAEHTSSIVRPPCSTGMMACSPKTVPNLRATSTNGVGCSNSISTRHDGLVMREGGRPSSARRTFSVSKRSNQPRLAPLRQISPVVASTRVTVSMAPL